jgi:hypothetical protein
MDNLANTIQNKSLAAMLSQAPSGVAHAIKKASVNTGVDFAYLVQQAKAESSFKPNIKAKSSSASGLYQFIESTWLNMVKKHGDKYGMGDMARKISPDGKVADPSAKKEILALRNDPEKASAMAAEFARDNELFLEKKWGGDVGSTELYFAHFLGAGQASAFLKERDENPMQQAALLFPKAAKANRNVFYDTKTGRAKTMDEVYAFFDKKFSIEDMKDTTIPGYAPSETSHVAENSGEADAHIAGHYNSIYSSVFVGGINRPQEAAVENFVSNGYAGNKPIALERPVHNSIYTSSYDRIAAQSLAANPVEIMLLSQMDAPLPGEAKNDDLFGIKN